MKKMLAGFVGLEVELRVEQHFFDQPLLPEIWTSFNQKVSTCKCFILMNLKTIVVWLFSKDSL